MLKRLLGELRLASGFPVLSEFYEPKGLTIPAIQKLHADGKKNHEIWSDLMVDVGLGQDALARESRYLGELLLNLQQKNNGLYGAPDFGSKKMNQMARIPAAIAGARKAVLSAIKATELAEKLSGSLSWAQQKKLMKQGR